MIPFAYRLRNGVRVVEQAETFLVVSEAPLRIIRVRPRAAHILRLCERLSTPAEIAAETDGATERQVWAICDYFRKKGLYGNGPHRQRRIFPFRHGNYPDKGPQGRAGGMPRFSLLTGLSERTA